MILVPSEMENMEVSGSHYEGYLVAQLVVSSHTGSIASSTKPEDVEKVRCIFIASG